MAQIETETKLNGKRCPGEEVCSQVPGRPLYEFGRFASEEQTMQSISDICGQCDLRPTKPGSQPLELAHWIATALDLDSLREMGASFAYPDALSVREWIALQSLSNARSQARMKELRSRQAQSKEDAEKERLKALVRRKS